MAGLPGRRSWLVALPWKMKEFLLDIRIMEQNGFCWNLPIVKQMTGRNRAAQLAIVKQMSRQ